MLNQINIENKYLMSENQQQEIKVIEIKKIRKSSQSKEQAGQEVSEDNLQDLQSLSQKNHSDQLENSSQPNEPALKSIKFRDRRGSKMKDLMKGRIDHDAFWEKNCRYFGGDLKNMNDEDEQESDYEASSSGRDEFDSDFDLTDSYPGKRGRKKGMKMKRSIKRESSSRPRGRPKKAKIESEDQSNSRGLEKVKQIRKKKKINSQQNSDLQRAKLKYRQVPSKSQDSFFILKAILPGKRGPKPKQASDPKQNGESIKNVDASSQLHE